MTRFEHRGTCAVAAIAFAGLCGTAGADFTIVALPDTQYYTDGVLGGQMAMFHSQTQWVVDNKDDRNIVFVAHEGDIVDHSGIQLQWDRANAAMSRLDGIVPYILCVGNHDMGPSGTASNRDTTLYNATFPFTRYENEPWYGGRMPNDGNDNYYVYFTADGMDFMIISLEFGPNDAMLAWANSVVAANPTRRTIVLTHCYMNYDDTRVGPTDAHNPHAYGIEFFDGGANDGEQMWTEFVSLHPNIFLVLSGHIFDPLNFQDGWGRLTSFGVRSNREDQIVANYQMWGGGGSGWLRTLRFIPEQDQVVVETYSPYLDQSMTDDENSFSFFYDMTVGPPPPPPPATLRLLRPQHCYQPGDTFQVSLWILNLGEHEAAGFQTFLDYDPRQLALVSGAYTGAPFGTHLVSPIAASGGEIDLASGVDALQDQQPTSTDALLATLTFQALVAQTDPAISFQEHVPPTTVADTLGSAIVHEEVNLAAESGDLNLDGFVNTLDLGILLTSWSLPATAPGCSGGHACLSDFNCDGNVNSLDLGTLLANWSL